MQDDEAKATLPNSLGSGTSVPYRKLGEAKATLPKKKHLNLPHIDIDGYYQFITFRTFDSIDSYLKKLYDTKKSNRQKQQDIDNYLDSSNSGAYLNDEVLEYLYDFLKTQDGKLYDLVAFCIMPNHIHLLLKPFDKLPKVMQKIKGSTAHHINKILNKSGKFWASNYYDKAIRDERHFIVVYEYIKNN
ncbi:MAG: transposase, partial [Campylobacterota bacterium]|nr:transposase [Campylobacterota bacterium]